MDHVAIMDKRLELIPKILSGEKSVESRWYMTRRAPWDRIAKGDVVYFKNVGEPIVARVDVVDVLQYANLDPVKVKRILNEYESRLGISRRDLFSRVKDKKYCIKKK